MSGPYTIRESQYDLKKYCDLFTCFAKRAVYIEETNALDTDSFFLVFRRFIARWCPARSITSDSGTNFIRTANESRKALDGMNHKQVKHYLQKNGNDWIILKNNPSAASHMGGIQECQIRTSKKILDALLQTHSCSLNDENSGHYWQRGRESLTLYRTQ